MTKHKAEKRAIRARMAKTGERYTTARHYVLNLHHVQPTVEADRELAAPIATHGTTPAPDVPAAYAAPAWIEPPGMSDEAIERNTGKSWPEWFAILDAWGAAERTHPEIARYLNETYNPGGWWAQNITVGYERARGRRRRHERPDGFSVSASKTVPVPVARLFAALVEETTRDQWLEPGTLRPRTSQPERSARFDVIPTGTLLTANLTAKGEDRASVQLQELKLASAADVASRRAYWKARLDRLAALLTS